MENKTYKIGQEFSITEKTGNQNIYKIKITKIENNGWENQYRMTFYSKHEMLDGSIKKEQSSSWHNSGSIARMTEYKQIVEKN